MWVCRSHYAQTNWVGKKPKNNNNSLTGIRRQTFTMTGFNALSN